MSTSSPAESPPTPDELDRSRTHLALALGAGGMGTWEWDIAGGRVSWSPEQERLCGLAPGSFDGTVEAYRARLHPEDAAGAWRRVEEALAARAEHHHVQHRIVRPDGEVRWLESHGRFLYDASGRPLRLVGVSTDVTDRVRFEHLRARQDQMLGAVDVGVWYCDLPFDVLVWDAKVKEHFWLPPDAHVTIDTFYARIHPDDRGRTRACIEHSIGARGPYDIEYRTVAPAGHPEAGAERWVRAIGYTAYDADGRPTRFDGVTVDVTATKRIAERLAESEQRYEYAARATSNAIWDWDFAADRVTWNPGVSTVFGYAPGEVEETGAWWSAHIHPEDRERVVAGIHRVIDGAGGGHSWRDEYRFRRADGAYADVVDRGYVARDAGGRAVRMIGAMEDVTARRAAEAEVRASERRFRSLVQATSAIVWTTSADGEFVAEQPDWAAFTGQSREEYRGGGWAAARAPRRPAGDAGAVRAALAARAPYEAEHRVRSAAASGATSGCARCRSSAPAAGGRVGGDPHRRDRPPRARASVRRRGGRVPHARELHPAARVDHAPRRLPRLLQRRWYDYTGMPRGYENGWDWKRFLPPTTTSARWRRGRSRCGPASRTPSSTASATRRRASTAGSSPRAAGARRVGGGGALVRHVHRHRGAEAGRGGARPGARRGAAPARAAAGVFTRSPSAVAVTEGPEHVTVVANAAYAEITGHRPLLGRRRATRSPSSRGSLLRAARPRVRDRRAVRGARGDRAGGPRRRRRPRGVRVRLHLPAAARRGRAGHGGAHARRRHHRPGAGAPARRGAGGGAGARAVAPGGAARAGAGGHLGERGARARDREPERHVAAADRRPQRGRAARAGRGARRRGAGVPGAARPGVRDRRAVRRRRDAVRFDFDGDGAAEERYFNIVYQPLREAGGRVRGILTHSVDVTAQVLARREVERKAAELAALSGALERQQPRARPVRLRGEPRPQGAVARHRQPRAVDRGGSGRPGGRRVREHMRLLKGRVHRMGALIDGILAYSRAGRVRVTPERVDLGAAAREAASWSRRRRARGWRWPTTCRRWWPSACRCSRCCSTWWATP
jgi:PAS domain S-box-containing protein